MRATGERGQAAPLLAAVVVLVGMLALLTVRIGGAAVDRARARTAADAAALAGAADGRAAAEEMAQANGGVLESYAEHPDGSVEVVVRAGPARAAARAAGGERGAVTRGVRGALAAASARLGHRIRVIAVRPGGEGFEVGEADAALIDQVGASVGLCRPSPDADPKLVARCARGG